MKKRILLKFVRKLFHDGSVLDKYCNLPVQKVLFEFFYDVMIESFWFVIRVQPNAKRWVENQYAGFFSHFLRCEIEKIMVAHLDHIEQFKFAGNFFLSSVVRFTSWSEAKIKGIFFRRISFAAFCLR